MKLKLIIIGFVIVYVILSINSAIHGGDFDVFLDAATKLGNHQNIYTPPFVKDLQYYYSPLFAFLLMPFTGNFFITEFLWLLLSGFILYRNWIIIQMYFDFSAFTHKERNILGALSLFFIIRFILYNVAMVQINIFLLWAILESIQLINSKKWLIGSLILAFVINVKLMPIVVLPYLIYRLKFRAAISVVAFSILFLFLPSIFIGHEFNTFLLAEWWKIINPLNSEHLIEAGVNSQSFVGIIPAFLTDTQGDINIKRNLLSLSIETTELITNIIRLFFIAFTLFFLKLPKKNNLYDISEFRAISYILLLVPLIFPHQQKYAFVFIFPMIVYLIYYCMIMWKFNRNKGFKIFLSLLLIVSVIFTPIIGSDIIGRFNYDLIHHFRILGISTILLVIFAVIGNPKSIKKEMTENNNNIPL
jgi:hypothetical protein